MAGKTQDGAQQARYLLGGGSEAERERLEAEFFANDDVFQEMLTAEDDLIDAYARGELSASEKREFEKRFLRSAEGRERVQFARAFAAATAPRAIATEPAVVISSPGFFNSIFGSATAWRPVFAAIAIAVIAGFGWLLVERSRMNAELNTLRAERVRLNQQADELQLRAEAEQKRTAELQAQLDAQGAKPDQPAIPNSTNNQIKKNEVVAGRDSRRDEKAIETGNKPVGPNVTETLASISFELTPGTTRGGQGNVLPVPAAAKYIFLTLGLETESSHDQYRVVIETPDGRAVKTLDLKLANPPHDRVLAPRISSRDLPPADYVIFLMAKKPDNTFGNLASYSFRIVRK